MKQKAFTLIELLVVIAVIAVLMGILMPVLSRAREMGKTIKCQANLRSLTMAWYTYATDNDDKLCGAYNHRGAGSGDAESLSGKPWDYAWAPWDRTTNAVAADLMSATLEQRKEGIRRGSLYPYTKDVAAYHCPSDRTAAQNYRSYSIPDSLNGQWGTNGYMNKAPWLNMRNLSQVSQPATAYVFLEEQDPRGYNANSWVIMSEKDATSWADPVVVWHDSRSSFGFADGHAETWRWSLETLDLFDQYDFFVRKTPVQEDGTQDLRRIRASWPRTRNEGSIDG